MQQIYHYGKKALRLVAVTLGRGYLRVSGRRYDPPRGAILVVAPHPDDETLGCGALISRQRTSGWPVHIIFVTDGSQSHPNHPVYAPVEIANLRQNEARQALAVLGVEASSTHFLNEPDGTLDRLTSERREWLVAQLCLQLRAIEPLAVFLPCSPDGSSEHDAAFSLMMDALATVETSLKVWQYPVWTWRNPFLIAQRILSGDRAIFLPTEDSRTAKIQALLHYRSQAEPLPPETSAALPPDFVRLFDAPYEYFFPCHPPGGNASMLRDSPPAI